MSLIERLRDPLHGNVTSDYKNRWNDARTEAADRIERLEAALRRIESGECVYDWADQPHEQMQDCAREALGEE